MCSVLSADKNKNLQRSCEFMAEDEDVVQSEAWVNYENMERWDVGRGADIPQEVYVPGAGI